MKSLLRLSLTLLALLVGGGGAVGVALCLPGAFTLSHLVWFEARSGTRMTIVAWWTTTWFNRMPYERAPDRLTFNFGQERYCIEPDHRTVKRIKDVNDFGGVPIGLLGADVIESIQIESGIHDVSVLESAAFCQRLRDVCAEGERGFRCGEAAKWIKREFADSPSEAVAFQGFDAMDAPAEVQIVCIMDGAGHAVVELQFWRVLAAIPGGVLGVWLTRRMAFMRARRSAQALTDPQA